MKEKKLRKNRKKLFSMFYWFYFNTSIIDTKLDNDTSNIFKSRF